MNSYQILLLAAAATALSTSCAASRGFGQDLQKIGGKIEREADATGGAAPLPAAPTGIYTPPAPVTPAAY
jgi:predicted small secreted protein